MDSIAPMLAVVALAGAELREWSHYPPAAVCKRNLAIAADYELHLKLASRHAEGNEADALWRQIEDARKVGYVWFLLDNITSNSARWYKLNQQEELISKVGWEAWARGEWPGPLPAHHFERLPAGASLPSTTRNP